MLKPYRIGSHPVWNDKEQKRFIYSINGIDYYGSINEYETVKKKFHNYNFGMPSDKYLCEKCKGMSDEEVQEATENIEQEKIDFQMDYVDFCNEFGYDANSRDSAKLYKYGRKIYNLDGVY